MTVLKVSLLIALVASLAALMTIASMIWAEDHVSATIAIDTLIISKLFDVIKMKLNQPNAN